MTPVIGREESIIQHNIEDKVKIFTVQKYESVSRVRNRTRYRCECHSSLHMISYKIHI